jgi:hypothetical protein
MLSLPVAEPAEATFVNPSFALMQKKQKIKAEKPVPMGAPWSGLQRGATHHACGMAQTAPLPLPHATTHPRPIGGTGFYAAFFVRWWNTHGLKIRVSERKSARVQKNIRAKKWKVRRSPALRDKLCC